MDLCGNQKQTVEKYVDSVKNRGFRVLLMKKRGFIMQSKAKAVSITGILAALSAILFVYPHFVVLPGFPMFKMDFADIPALLAASVVSPFWGVIVILIRNSVHLFMTDTLGIGELSNFIISSGYVFVAGYIIRFAKTQTASLRRTIGAMTVATIVAVAVSALSNYFLIIRLYEMFVNPEIMSFVGGVKNYIIAGVLPFNAIKAGLNSIIFVTIYKALIPKIRRYL